MSGRRNKKKYIHKRHKLLVARDHQGLVRHRTKRKKESALWTHLKKKEQTNMDAIHKYMIWIFVLCALLATVGSLTVVIPRDGDEDKDTTIDVEGRKERARNAGYAAIAGAGVTLAGLMLAPFITPVDKFAFR